MNRLKNEKGSITLFVLVAVLFFAIILTLAYISATNKLSSQEDQVSIMQSNYGKNIGNEESVYEKEYDESLKEKNIYVVLYTDNTLVFSNTDEKITGKIVEADFTNIWGKEYSSAKEVPWNSYGYSATIETVIFNNKIFPTSTAYWFYGFTNLTAITNMNNLDTSNVTDMSYMFSGLTTMKKLDISNFDVTNVKKMDYMFYASKSLTEIDVDSSWSISSKSTTNMFTNCGVSKVTVK
jgi:surface protein